MRTIEELITIEKQYIQERLQGLTNIDFVSILQDNGFTPEEYQYNKGEYFLKTFNPVFMIGNATEVKNYIYDMADQKQNILLCVIPDQKIVWHPINGDFNKEYCDTNNIFHDGRPYIGGTVCALPSDLDIDIVAMDAPTNFSRVIMDKIATWIKSKIDSSISVIVTGNDILIDNMKVLGMVEYTYQDACICEFHLSFDIDLEFIQQVCIKEMVKIPAGLNNFGLFNREELITEIRTWLK